MAVDIYAGERFVATVGEDVIEWFDRARHVLGTANPFSGLAPYGEVTLDPPSGEVAAFASALSRTLGALERSPDGLPPLPVVADERDPDGDEFDAEALVTFIRRLRDAMAEADANGVAVVAAGD